MKKIFILVVLALSIFTFSTNAHAVSADIMWLIDTSGSMNGDITEVKTRMSQFNTAMTDAGIDAHYGLTEFGGTSGNANTNSTASLTQDITDFTTFVAGGSPFQNLSASGGGVEEGSLAVTTALSTATYRQGSVINFILVTDEDDDSTATVFGNADTALGLKNALFNFIGVPGTGNTDARYGTLAANHGGAAFNIIDFRDDPDPFFENFVATKVEEIQNNAIPEPATMILFTTGLVGAALRRKFAA